MTKSELLSELSNNTYVMLKPSPIEGVGVFAIRDIPKGCRGMFSKPGAAEEWITVSREEVNALPAHAQFLVGNYCLFDEEQYFLPADGFKKLDLALFLNHSDQPNIISINDGDYFEAISAIKAGEELVIDYGEIVDGEE
ncbi:MAG: SET domain-containing protein [Bacteroidetes bacterium]|nr:SET domain-containing protein [Bacteroidota bacterium]